MSTLHDQSLEHLTALGFTEVEAAVYVFLLTESPATGYRVAQGTGRTAANAYKALESLERRGAVIVEEGETRLCRAVPPEELLRSIESAFMQHRRKAARALGRIRVDQSDDRVYQLRTAAQVYERARSVLRSAREVVLMDVFPRPFAHVADELTAAAARGVRVAVFAYEPAALPGVDVIVNYQAESVRQRWNGDWLNIVADSTQHVLALLSPRVETVLHGTWSASVFLAHLYHSGLLGEMSTSVLRDALERGLGAEDVSALLARLDGYEHTRTPAFSALSAAEDS